MTGTLTIAARELRERSFVFVTAAVMSLVPFIAAALPKTRNEGPLTVIMIMGAITALGFTTALSIILGGSMAARELGEKRLSFYFSKPVSASTIWFGKVLGAIATVALCFAIALTPALVVAHREWRIAFGWSTGSAILVLAVASISLLLISHAVNTAVRSRSPFVALDISLLAVAVAAVWLLSRPLFVNGAGVLFLYVLGGVVLMVPVIILFAGAWQFSHGRTDIRRSHRELSLFFWSATAVVLLVAAGYVAWVFSAGPRDITFEEVTSNSRADWVGVAGRANHRGDYHPTFLVDVKTGRSIRLTGSQWTSRAEFTRGGDAVVAVSPSAELEGRGDVHVYRLSAAKPDEDTGIVVALWSVLVVSDDLRRMATVEQQILSVHDLPTKTQLASVRIPFGVMAQMFFVSDDVLRLYARNSRGANASPQPQEMRIYEFNVKTRQLTQTGSVNAVAKAMITRVNPSGSTLVVNEYGGEGGPKVRLLDARSGAERGVINSRAPFSVAPLRDGGVAFIASEGAVSSARIFDAHGSLIADVPLGSKGYGGVREVVPGRKYIAIVLHTPQDRNGSGSDLYVVDAQRRVVERVERNFGIRSQFNGDDPRNPTTEAGEYIIVDAQNTLWRWNALTGAKVKVL